MAKQNWLVLKKYYFYIPRSSGIPAIKEVASGQDKPNFQLGKHNSCQREKLFNVYLFWHLFSLKSFLSMNFIILLRRGGGGGGGRSRKTTRKIS
jgi:hypothetical protein